MPGEIDHIATTLAKSQRATLLLSPGGRETFTVSTIDDNGHINRYGLVHADLGALMAMVGKLLAERAAGSLVVGSTGSLVAQSGTSGPGTPPIGGPHGMPTAPYTVHLAEAMHEQTRGVIGAIQSLANTAIKTTG